MTWIRTVSAREATGELARVYRALADAFPAEYGTPSTSGDSIVSAHSPFPEAMEGTFMGYAALLRPELPLSRAQHEMIATLVSVVNRCRH
jgi:hypothetical protein